MLRYASRLAVLARPTPLPVPVPVPVAVAVAARFLHAAPRAAAPLAGLEVAAAYDKHYAPGCSRMTKIAVEWAKGSWVKDSISGKTYLDFTCGIGATNTGHCHPKVVKAAQAQLEKGIHLQQNILMSPVVGELITRLTEIVPKPLSRFFFNNSGSESVESAMKLARHVTGRGNIISVQGGFHGRTIGCLSVTSSKYVYGIGYGPFMPGVHRVPFPYCLRCPSASAGGNKGVQPNDAAFVCCGNPLEQLRVLLKQASHPKDTAAILVEPVLGEGGFVIPPASYLQGIRKICDDNGFLMIADEVQSGFGRTGKYFAIEHSGVVPDIMIMAKGIASGLPLGCIAAKPHLMEIPPSGSMGGTYGGNSVCAAAAIATIDVFQTEDLLGNTRARGAQLMTGLHALQKAYPCIRDVRGLGLMVAVEFDDTPGIANAVSQAALKHELMLLTAGAFEVIRFLPPLTVTADEIDKSLTRFAQALADVTGVAK